MTLRAFCALARFSMIAYVTSTSLWLCSAFQLQNMTALQQEVTIILQIYLLRLEKFNYICGEKREFIYSPLPSWSDPLPFVTPAHRISEMLSSTWPEGTMAFKSPV